jgi:ATP-dependent protease ClpP protease subunit
MNKIKNIHPTITQQETFHIYINGDIESPEHYIEELQILKNATEGTMIYLYINSRGGDVAAGLQLAHNIDLCQGVVHGIIEGVCYSAATYVFLSCHSFDLSPFAHMMIHNYSGGHFGRGNELVLSASETNKWISAAMGEIYRNFLTEEELVTVTHTDIYLGPQDIADRLDVLQEARNSALKETETTAVNTMIEELQYRIAEHDTEHDTKNSDGIQESTS